MLIKSIMIPRSKLQCLSVNDSISDVTAIFDSNGLLSMPVVDGDKFVGLLSKGYIYEWYFKSEGEDRKGFLGKQVGEFIKTTIPTIDENTQTEDAATLFLNSNLRFLPVTKPNGKLVGIVTHKTLFKDYQGIFGMNCPKIVIYAGNYKGVLAKIATIISKENGNIKNIVQKDIDLMGLQEVTLRVECTNIKRIVKELISNGIPVRYYSEGDDVIQIDPHAGTQPVI